MGPLAKSRSVQNGKYLEWIGKIVSANNCNLDELTDLLFKFETNKDKLKLKDIYQYSTPEDLQSSLSSLTPSRNQIKSEGATEVAEINGIKIIFLERAEAAKLYCAGTRWCISNTNTFYYYCKERNIYLLQRGNTKFCILVTHKGKRLSFYSPNDYQFGTQEIVDLVNLIGPEIKSITINHTQNFKNEYAQVVDLIKSSKNITPELLEKVFSFDHTLLFDFSQKNLVSAINIILNDKKFEWVLERLKKENKR